MNNIVFCLGITGKLFQNKKYVTDKLEEKRYRLSTFHPFNVSGTQSIGKVFFKSFVIYSGDLKDGRSFEVLITTTMKPRRGIKMTSKMYVATI